jgi:hypothetical protein
MEATTPAGSPLVTMDRLVSSDDRASDPDRRPAVHAIHALCDLALAAARLAVVVDRRRHEDSLSASPSGSPCSGGGSGGGSMFSGKEQPSGGKIHA